MSEDHTNSKEYAVVSTSKICDTFDNLRTFFPDELNNSGDYIIKGRQYKTHFCKSNYTDVDKINGYILWLFNSILNGIYNCESKESCVTVGVVYILGWLSYKLDQKTENKVIKLNDFYTMYIENGKEYKQSIENYMEYKTYKEIIDKNKKLMDVDIKVISKFYDLFNNLCKMYNELSKVRSKSEEYLKYVNNFADNYNILFNDANSNLFKQVLSAASYDYNYIKNTSNVESIIKQFPELITEKKTQITLSSDEAKTVSSNGMPSPSSDTKVSDSETEVLHSENELSNSETAQSIPLVINKLIPIPFIFVVTLILLGIVYKYSLFGFRKRSQKQYLIKKLKK
ncbi:hypothetical protein YYC_04818 [Plasmodium yoelii 17X]|uniref:YIR protein n=1 Tax=Plasmodium yoelii 17X TaxID=1323249 RepID=V7PE74_PLAYE|nr:hypothetical protein YYC_04818 [Plasmodium yoelii 17X]